MKSLLDPSFRYTPSTSTDLRRTFARIRREQAAQKKEAARELIPIHLITQRGPFRVRVS